VPKWKSAVDNGALVRALNGEIVHERASLTEFNLDDPAALEVSARRIPAPDVCAFFVRRY
jgi:hypothetical protein